MTLRRARQMLWASPTTLVGLVLAFLLGAFPKRVIRGQVLQFEARWGFWKWLNGRGFVATTFGNVSILSPVYIYDLPTQRHEAVHTAQAYVWGPTFPARVSRAVGRRGIQVRRHPLGAASLRAPGRAGVGHMTSAMRNGATGGAPETGATTPGLTFLDGQRPQGCGWGVAPFAGSSRVRPGRACPVRCC
jgi:hypothetical protein